MSEIRRLEDQLRRAVEGEAWHGPSVLELLSGVTAAAAAARPVRRAHSIWEIVQHMTAWQEVGLRRLEGEPAREIPAEEDWPAITDASEQSWKQTREDLERVYRELRAAIARCEDSRLTEKVTGTEYSQYGLLHGVIQHNLYHAGQIALLKRALA